MTKPGGGKVPRTQAVRLNRKRVTVYLDSSLAMHISTIASVLEMTEDELINDMLELARTSRKFTQYQRSKQA